MSVKIGSNTTLIYKGRVVSMLRRNSLISPAQSLIVLVNEIFLTEKTIIKSCGANGNWDSLLLCAKTGRTLMQSISLHPALILLLVICGWVSAFQGYKQVRLTAICKVCWDPQQMLWMCTLRKHLNYRLTNSTVLDKQESDQILSSYLY